jgi:hypothetical protein
MMQSVALTDSCQHDEDFVIVEAEGTHNCVPTYVYDDDDDLDSYDYCEDAYSAPLVAQPLTTDPALTFQHEFLDYPLSYNLNQEGQHSSPSACVPKILSPGISLIPFGEANSSDEAEADSVEGSIAASEISTSTREDEGEKERISRRVHQVKDSDTDNDGTDSDAAPSASSGSSVAGDGGSDSLRYTDPFAPMSTKRDESSRASSSSSSSSVVSASAHQKTPSVSDDSSAHSTSSKMSRVSNKKLRKQLKSAKKAAAAAAAAALSPTSRNKKTTKKSNKKQVACATQGLASYREEVSRNNKNFR